MRFMGHDFRQMTDEDFMGLAGAEAGSWIVECVDCLLVLSPDKKTMSVIAFDVDNADVETVWQQTGTAI